MPQHKGVDEQKLEELHFTQQKFLDAGDATRDNPLLVRNTKVIVCLLGAGALLGPPWESHFDSILRLVFDAVFEQLFGVLLGPCCGPQAAKARPRDATKWCFCCSLLWFWHVAC